MAIVALSIGRSKGYNFDNKSKMQTIHIYTDTYWEVCTVVLAL